KYQFEPARDARGRAMATTILWRLEWPSPNWLKMAHVAPAAGGVVGFGSSRRLGPRVRAGGFMLPAKEVKLPPCRGAGALNLDSLSPGYRDCSLPDLAKAADEPVITVPPEE